MIAFEDSAIGVSRSSTSASWMFGFLMPADVRRSFTMNARCHPGGEPTFFATLSDSPTSW